MKKTTALLKDRLRRLEKENKKLKKTLLAPVKIYFLEQYWLGTGGIAVSVNADGDTIQLHREPYRPGTSKYFGGIT